MLRSLVEFQKEKKVLGQIRMEALQNKAVKKSFIVDETWNKSEGCVPEGDMPIWALKWLYPFKSTGKSGWVQTL